MTLAEVMTEARLNVERVKLFLNITDEPNVTLLRDISDELALAARQIQRARIIVEEGRDPIA